jgi:diguanylate cyclase (GGDEF)-like protein
MFLGPVAPIFCQAPGTLTTLHAIHSLSNSEAGKTPPVAFEATVTYRRSGESTLFVQDGLDGSYVWANPDIQLNPGDRVLVRGRAQASFRPIVIADSVTILRHEGLPAPVKTTFDELVGSKHDCMRIALRATVLSADLGLSADHNDTHLVLLADGGVVEVYVNSGDARILNELLDAEVQVAGVAQMRFDGKMQPTGVALSVPSLEDVRILRRAPTSPWSLPITPMDEILTHFRANASRRVRVQGIITYYQPGSAVVVQSGTKSLWIATAFEQPLRIGQLADVTGFPDVHVGFLTLTSGEIQETAVYSPIAPLPVTRRQVTSSQHIFDLISIEGQVVMEVRESSQDQYVLISDGQVFSATFRHPDVAGLPTPAMKKVALGSKVAVAGICIPEGSNPFEHQVPFDILMRAPGDIRVFAGPSLLNVRNLAVLAAVLTVIVLAVGARGWAIEGKMRRHAAAVAALEQRRSRILEDINGSRPLAEILEEITGMVSQKLGGAPCWSEVTDGARLGSFPSNADSLRILREQIPGRLGPPLGFIFAALNPHVAHSGDESKALSMGAELAELAIETRRLYADLRHRSEFDLLTDIHNRGSLDRLLNEQIEDARQKAGIFGLIYIDLDEFKQVNDLYGHQVGDLYLQEVAQRMKRQLRPHDMLARLGGDEFAVLVPMVRSRTDVEEIAVRLEHSFDEDYAVEGFVLRGSASVGIALYPADATTRDTLLSAADAAMYVAKHTRREASARQENPRPGA